MTWAICNNAFLHVPMYRVEVGAWKREALGLRAACDGGPVGVDSLPGVGDPSFVETCEQILT